MPNSVAASSSRADTSVEVVAAASSSASAPAEAQAAPADRMPAPRAKPPYRVPSRVTDLVGSRYPLIQGAMAHIADARLAAAVSNAGGVGIIACGGRDASWVRAEVARARELTDRPFGANVMLKDPHAADIAAVLAELAVPVITTGAGSPSAFIDAWHEAGSVVIPVVASAALARRMERAGADAVVAEGCESGGHVGELTTMALVPSVCDAVSLPVIAAGGIADERGAAAAFALGAEGIQVGTRFLCARECCVAPAYKQRVIRAKDADTIVCGRGSGHPVRQLKNRFSRRVHAAEASGTVAPDELQLAGSLARAVAGDVEEGALMAGQAACLVHGEQRAEEIVDELMAGLTSWGNEPLFAQIAANAQRARRRAGDAR